MTGYVGVPQYDWRNKEPRGGGYHPGSWPKPNERFDMPDDTEIWKPVLGYEGQYEVSDAGRVRSLPRTVLSRLNVPQRRNGKILKLWLIGRDGGHYAVGLHRDGHRVTRKVHVLVLESFVGARPDGLVGCHNDGNVENNTVSNLRWDTMLENARDTLRHGRNFQSNKTHCIRGHEFTADNVNFAKKGGARLCRKCQQQQGREAYQRKLSRLRERGITKHDPSLLYKENA